MSGLWWFTDFRIEIKLVYCRSLLLASMLCTSVKGILWPGPRDFPEKTTDKLKGGRGFMWNM